MAKKTHAARTLPTGGMVAKCGGTSQNFVSFRQATCKHCNPDGVLPITVLVGGQTLQNVHPADKCAGEFCTIHNNSDHHMKTWPQNWRSDRRIMERICPHGVGHPDPDDPALKFAYESVHGCDGCCSPGCPLNGYWEQCCDGGCEYCDDGWVYQGNEKY